MNNHITFKLNGREMRLNTDPDRMLLWVLRSDLDHTGTKYSCGEGFCGACTVLIDEEPVLACQYPVGDAAGRNILTIEGLEREDALHPVQEAFLRHNAIQCGYCTPGMVLAAYGLLLRNPDPGESDIKDALEGNLCRCGAYDRIVKAVRTAAETMKGLRP